MQRSTKRGSDIVADFDLWEEVRETAVPIHSRKARPSAAAMSQREGAKSPPTPMKTAPAPEKRKSSPAAPRHQLTGLDRRTAQRLTRGKLAVDARIDLHGARAGEARHRLLGFLAAARIDGHRNILVITGKGASPYGSSTLHGRTHFDAPERQGLLRRLLPEWIGEAEFRQHVSGFQPAHPRHGGGGAFYVRLRRLSQRDR